MRSISLGELLEALDRLAEENQRLQQENDALRGVVPKPEAPKPEQKSLSFATLATAGPLWNREVAERACTTCSETKKITMFAGLSPVCRRCTAAEKVVLRRQQKTSYAMKNRQAMRDKLKEAV